MQSVSDALAVFERQVDGGIHVRADGIVVVVLLRVELVGEIANAYPNLKVSLLLVPGVMGKLMKG